MRMKCVICKKEQIPNDYRRSFHQFPKNEEQRRKWFSALNIEIIKSNSGVCSDHFHQSYFCNTGEYTKKRLKANAVPTTAEINDFHLDENQIPETLNPTQIKMECNAIASETMKKSNNKTEYEDSVPIILQRKCSSFVESIVVRKKYCFSKERDIISITKEDFVSEEAWQNFMKSMSVMRNKLENQRKELCRRKDKLVNLREIVDDMSESKTKRKFLEVS